jgi:asparagine synthase (glutamine-hydrolysing)
MMHVDLQRTLADGDLLKVGRMCEIAGVEVRYPFLDDDLVTFSAGIPGPVLLTGGALRGFYKNAYRDFLAPETISKPKQGFGLPTVEWMRGSADILDLVRDGIESFARRGYMREGFCQIMIQSLVERGSPYLSSSAWDVLLLELWLRDRGFAA